jgi:hypothetical protein
MRACSTAVSTPRRPPGASPSTPDLRHTLETHPAAQGLDCEHESSLPRRVETGFAIIDKDNVDDPAVARFIYQVPGK